MPRSLSLVWRGPGAGIAGRDTTYYSQVARGALRHEGSNPSLGVILSIIIKRATVSGPSFPPGLFEDKRYRLEKGRSDPSLGALLFLD